MDTIIKQVVMSYVKAILFVAWLTFIAYLLALYVNAHINYSIAEFVKQLQILSAILMGASLGKRGYEIQTWGGQTPAEKLNEKVFVVFSGLGYFILIFSLYL